MSERGEVERDANGVEKSRETIKRERLARMEEMGHLDPRCSKCREFYDHPDGMPFAPDHKPSDACESGKRPHCTCDRCF